MNSADGGGAPCPAYTRMRGLEAELSILQCKATELCRWKQSLIDLLQTSVIPQSTMLSEALASRGAAETESQVAAHYNAVQLLRRWYAAETDSSTHATQKYPTRQYSGNWDANSKENNESLPNGAAVRRHSSRSTAAVVQRLDLSSCLNKLDSGATRVSSRRVLLPDTCAGLGLGGVPPDQNNVGKLCTTGTQNHINISTGGILHSSNNYNTSMRNAEAVSTPLSHNAGHRYSPSRWTTGPHTNTSNNKIHSIDGITMLCGAHTQRQSGIQNAKQYNIMNNSTLTAADLYRYPDDVSYDTGGVYGSRRVIHDGYSLGVTGRGQLLPATHTNSNYSNNVNMPMSVRSNTPMNNCGDKLSGTAVLSQALQPYHTVSSAGHGNTVGQQYSINSAQRLHTAGAADACDFKPLDEDTFLAVPSIVRRRAKLHDVNELYNFIWDHTRRLIEKDVLFKGNSERKRAANLGITLKTTKLVPKMSAIAESVVIPRSTFIKNGISVVGQTGESKVMTLRHLRIIEFVGRDGSVRLSPPLLSGMAGTIITSCPNYSASPLRLR